MGRPHLLFLGSLLLACGDDAPRTSDVEAGRPQVADAGNTTAPLTDAGPGVVSDAGAPVVTSSSSRYLPADSWLYQRVDTMAVDKDSPTITKWLTDQGGFGTGQMRIDFSIEVLTAEATTPRHAFEQTADFYSPDCDSAPFPVPERGSLEGEDGYACTSDGDCHLLVVDPVGKRLYEMWRANITGGHHYGGCAAIWDMTRSYGPEGRGEQCSSADAAGFPIAPLLFSADEVAAGSIDHAIRFILPNARMRAKTYQHPANHAGGPSGGTDAPIYGSRWRLKASFDLSKLPSEGARVVARALQRYGMALADGGNIALTGQSDKYTTHKWEGLLGTRDLVSITPGDFEIVETGEPIALTYDCTRTPITD